MYNQGKNRGVSDLGKVRTKPQVVHTDPLQFFMMRRVAKERGGRAKGFGNQLLTDHIIDFVVETVDPGEVLNSDYLFSNCTSRGEGKGRTQDDGLKYRKWRSYGREAEKQNMDGGFSTAILPWILKCAEHFKWIWRGQEN